MTTPLVDRPIATYTEPELDAIIEACTRELAQANAFMAQMRATATLRTLAMSAKADRFGSGLGRRKRLL